MSPPDLLGAVLLIALVFYALLGGADFGGGILDLFARGPREREQRALIERAIGPIWEANHVWLILVIVVLFTAFPAAFAAVCIGLFGPLMALLIGIVLRGAAFTFRTYDSQRDAVQRRWGTLFSLSSVAAPVMLGTIVGALGSGRVRVDAWAAGAASGAGWFSVFAILIGMFAAALFAYLAAVYLAVEAEGALAEDFRWRAIVAGVVVFLAALASAVASWREAPAIFAGLTARVWSLPFHAATGLAAAAAFVALFRRRYRLARFAAAAQVALIVLGWGASQYPYLVVPDLTLAAASAPRRIQVTLLWALAAGALLLFPCLYLLFRVFKGERPFSIVDRTPARR